MATRKQIDNWIRRMEACYKAIPPGLEAHVGYNSVHLYEAGRYAEHMLNQQENGYGINDDSEVGTAFTGGRLIPYGEGS